MSVPYNYMNSMPGQGQKPNPLAPKPPLSTGMAPGTTNPMAPTVMTPEMISAMTGTYGYQLELNCLDEQMAKAEALRNAPGPEGRDSGRVYTAANPLEHIGAGIQKYRAGRDMQQIDEGVRNPGYAPGITNTAQPEFSKMGRTGLRARIGENVSKYGQNIPGLGALFNKE